MSEMSILEMRRLLKERALEGNKASTVIRHQMAAAKAKYDAETDASKNKSMGTVGGAVGPFALDKGYDALVGDEAAKEGLAGVKDYGAPVQSYNAQGIPNQLTPKGAEFNTPLTSEASVFNAANHGTVGGTVGGGSTVGTITPAVVNPGPPVSVFNPASVTGPGSVSSMTEGALAGSAKGGSIGMIEGAGTGMVTGLEGAGTGMASNVVTPVAAVPAAAPAGALATGAAGLGAGLGGAAGAYGGKALAAEFTDDPTIQGVASVGGGALGGAAAGAAIGSAGGPIGAPIGAIIGAIGGLLGAF